MPKALNQFSHETAAHLQEEVKWRVTLRNVSLWVVASLVAFAVAVYLLRKEKHAWGYVCIGVGISFAAGAIWARLDMKSRRPAFGQKQQAAMVDDITWHKPNRGFDYHGFFTRNNGESVAVGKGKNGWFAIDGNRDCPALLDFDVAGAACIRIVHSHRGG